MMSLNRAQIIGNTTRDPEVRSTSSGQSVANFSVATNTSWTDAQGQKQERTEFHNIVAWGKLGEICGQYITKGRKVYVEGRLQTRDWETPEGQKRQRTEIIAENVIILDRPSQGGGYGQSASMNSSAKDTSADGVEKTMGSEEIRVEDIPF